MPRLLRSPTLGRPITLRAAAPVLILATAALVACGDHLASRRGEASGAADSVGVVPSAPPVADMVAATEAIASRAAEAKLAVPQGATNQVNLPSGSASTGAAVGAAPTVTSMIIRTGTASVEVDSLERAIAAVQRIATSLGGWVGNASMAGGAHDVRSATLEVKVPAARYEEALAGLRPIGKVESISSNAEDVGEEYVDIAARTANAHRLEERLITLLATRTGKLEDVLNVERELARVREEIERYEGRLRYLKARAATSTLTVTVHERFPIVAPNTPGENIIGEAFRDAWRNFVRFAAAFIASLGTVVPVAILLAGAAAAWRRFRGRQRPALLTPHEAQ